MATPYSSPPANGRTEAAADTAEAPVRDAAPKAESLGAKQPGGNQSDELTQIWATLLAHSSELREYAGLYIAANVDRLKLTLRAGAMWAAFAAVAAIIVTAIVSAASVVLVLSMGTGLGELLGGREWAGQLIVSVIILCGATGGLVIVINRALRRHRRAIIKKYERRKQQERSTYGTDAQARAQERSRVAT